MCLLRMKGWPGISFPTRKLSPIRSRFGKLAGKGDCTRAGFRALIGGRVGGFASRFPGSRQMRAARPGRHECPPGLPGLGSVRDADHHQAGRGQPSTTSPHPTPAALIARSKARKQVPGPAGCGMPGACHYGFIGSEQANAGVSIVRIDTCLIVRCPQKLKELLRRNLVE
jgi:hypothetical protein